MSYEGDKARLIRELADAQAQIRAEYKMAPKPGPGTDEKKPPGHGGRADLED